MNPRQVSTAKALVRAGSPLAVENRLRTVAERVRRWEHWLNNRHPYNNNIIRTLRKNSDIDGVKLGEYIACSTLLHLFDGWNYLSRAFDAASSGDRGSAYHLAYYGELRAAISLLATEGIGIFNRRHIALNARLEPTEFRRGKSSGTHQATWLLLSAWSRESGRAARLLQAITVESKSLSEWLAAVGVVDAARELVAKQWLNAWSIDLKTMSADPRRRNEISYRPSRIRPQGAQPVDPILEMANPIFNSWAELDPNLGWAPAALDLSLLRQAIRLAIRSGLSNYSTFNQAVRSLQNDMADATFQELRTGRATADTVFREAEINSLQGNIATPILARSLLLLRLASASTASLFDAAGVTKADLKFWWAALGTDLGWWDAPEDIEMFSDLWSDVGDAKDDAEARLSAFQGGVSVRAANQILDRNPALTQFARAPMWLLGLD